MEKYIDELVLADLKERSGMADKYVDVREMDEVDAFDFNHGWHSGFASGIGYAIRKLGLSDKMKK